MQLLTYKYSRRDDLLEISQLETIQPNEIDPLEPTKCHRHGGIPAVGRENKPMRLTHHNSTFPAWHFLPSSTALSFVFSSSPSSFPQINFLTPMCSVISSFRFLYFPLYRYSTVGNASTPRKFLKIPGTTSRSCRQFFLDFPTNSTGRYIGLAFFPVQRQHVPVGGFGTAGRIRRTISRRTESKPTDSCTATLPLCLPSLPFSSFLFWRFVFLLGVPSTVRLVCKGSSTSHSLRHHRP